MRTFDTPRPIRLRVSFGAGEIAITAAETAQTTVDVTPYRDDEAARDLASRTTIDHHDDEVLVDVPRQSFGFFGRKPALRLAVTVPTGSALHIRTESGDVEAHGNFGETSIESGSGDVRLDSVAAEARIRTGSGDAFVERVKDSLRIESGSGDLTIGQVFGDASISTGSGDISIDVVAGDVRVNSASGDVTVQAARSSVFANTASGDLQLLRVERGRVRATSASGDVHIGVASGTAAWLDVTTLSGNVASDLDGTEQPGEHEETVQLQVNTASGDITLVHA